MTRINVISARVHSSFPLLLDQIAGNPAALGMLNGREYIPFDIQETQEGLIKLTDWVNMFARQKQEGLHKAQLMAEQSQLMVKDQIIAQLQGQYDVAIVLLVFVSAAALAIVISKS